MSNTAYRFISAVAAASLTVAAIVYFMPVRGEAELFGDVLRLHVIGNSDSEYDQSVKLAVRDASAPLVYVELDGIEDAALAHETVAELLDEIAAAAEETLEKYGADYGAEVRLTREYFPEKTYEGASGDSFTLPEGEYRSVTVTLGEGAGKNWWCVLFPPICKSSSMITVMGKDAFIAAGFTPEQYRQITESGGITYRVRFKLADIFAKLFGR